MFVHIKTTRFIIQHKQRVFAFFLLIQSIKLIFNTRGFWFAILFFKRVKTAKSRSLDRFFVPAAPIHNTFWLWLTWWRWRLVTWVMKRSNRPRPAEKFLLSKDQRLASQVDDIVVLFEKRIIFHDRIDESVSDHFAFYDFDITFNHLTLFIWKRNCDELSSWNLVDLDLVLAHTVTKRWTVKIITWVSV